ncbi:amino acid ABC transporter permease [Nocardioides sp. 616]|uniref:amino acid ABC transporter permease n=1 Tax=Nocardioides sp. 616 TaxID=2268090 RepID=UPI000CE3BF28|nr:amino acid ABC transporter permease [Nocardioides sp. 616]
MASPRQRARRSRLIQYVVLVLVLVLVASAVDVDEMKRAFFNTEVIRSMFPDVLLIALKNTVIYTACAFAFGLVLGLVLALMRLSPVGPYRWLATAFIEFFRGVPALVVFLAIGTGVPLAFPGRDIPGGVLGKVTLALGLVGAAYMAETIRAGIQAVPKGQLEAARSLGMSHTRAMISVVIPQAFRIILPPLTNELILLTKDSSLVYVLGVYLETQELTKFGRETMNTSNSLTALVVVGFCYLLITIPLSIVVRQMENRSERAR